MQAGKGKLKGSRFERDVCRALSLWLSQGEREDVFWRSAMSGGRATIAMNKEMKLSAAAGDISTITALGERLLRHIYIECKSYNDLQMFSGVTKQTGFLWKFWNDTQKQAARYDKSPMLIAHQNVMPTVCLIADSAMYPFGLSKRNAVAILPYWECHVVLLDAFVREAAVPLDDYIVAPVAGRVRL